MNYEEFFKGKKITCMGLGLIGKGAINPAFLAECGAEVIATDLKTEEVLKPTIEKLKKFPNIRFSLGGHKFEDFENVDMILKNQGVPDDSQYLVHARKNGIPVEMDESLFAKLAPEVTIVGITGTRGKSTTTHLVYHILKSAGLHVYIGGNLPGMAVLPLLKEVKKGDVIVLELSSWQLQGFGESHISPHIAIFTNFMPDHLNYYKNDLDAYFNDKASIFRYQKSEDVLIVGKEIYELRIKNEEVNSKLIIAEVGIVPMDWKIQIPGEHNKANIACAVEACRALGVSVEEIQKGVESFLGVEGRLQFVREVGGVQVYNDNNATTPEATVVALRALGNLAKKNIVLIFGGDDKKLDMSKLVEEIPKWCSKVVMFKERGTDTIRDKVFECEKEGIQVFEEEGLEATVKKAFEVAKAGETILYSPAFSSFGKYFRNEYDRNDQFLALAKSV